MKDKKYLNIVFVLALAILSGCASSNSSVENPDYADLSPFGVSYEKISPAQVKPYKLLIVEPNHYNKAEVKALQSRGAKVVAYLSVGQVNKNRWYYPILEKRGFLGKAENWDSYYINWEDSTTYQFFIDKVIPEITVRGFDGIFFDTVDDVAPHTSRANLEPYVVDLIDHIHNKYPQLMLIQNAGLFLLNHTAPLLDAVLIEDVATRYDFQDSTYNLRPVAAYQDKLASIKASSRKYKMPFLLVDFARTDSLRALAAQRLDSLPFPYFINSMELNDLSKGLSGNSY